MNSQRQVLNKARTHNALKAESAGFPLKLLSENMYVSVCMCLGLHQNFCMLKPANHRHFPRWRLLIGDYKCRATGVWNRGGRKQFSSIKLNYVNGWYLVKHVVGEGTRRIARSCRLHLHTILFFFLIVYNYEQCLLYIQVVLLRYLAKYLQS